MGLKCIEMKDKNFEQYKVKTRMVMEIVGTSEKIKTKEQCILGTGEMLPISLENHLILFLPQLPSKDNKYQTPLTIWKTKYWK